MPKVLLFKTTKKQSITFTLNDSNIIEVKHCIDDGSLNGVTETWCLLSEHQKAISKLPFSFNALIAFAESNQIPPTTTTDNKLDIAKGESLGVVESAGVAQHSNECRTTSPVEGSAFTEQDNKDFPKWGVTLRGLPLPTQAPPLTAENKNNSFIFRIMNDTHWVVLRHDWDDKNIYIHSAKYQTTFFQMCTQDNEKRSIAVPYSPHNLTLLLSARTCPALIHLAQSLSNDAQEVEQ